MKAFISKRAALAAERIDEHWREHAADPGIFARELLEAIEMLETSRGLGVPHPTPSHPLLLRALLRKSRCHVYFEIDTVRETIQILHIWDGRRARPPTL